MSSPRIRNLDSHTFSISREVSIPPNSTRSSDGENHSEQSSPIIQEDEETDSRMMPLTQQSIVALVCSRCTIFDLEVGSLCIL